MVLVLPAGAGGRDDGAARLAGAERAAVTDAAVQMLGLAFIHAASLHAGPLPRCQAGMCPAAREAKGGRA